MRRTRQHTFFNKDAQSPALIHEWKAARLQKKLAFRNTHELVHVEQYRQLGIPKFADLYVRGFLNAEGTTDYRLNATPICWATIMKRSYADSQ
jgi:hypothetical protein